MLSLSLAAKLFFIIILNILNGGIMVCNEEAASEKKRLSEAASFKLFVFRELYYSHSIVAGGLEEMS